MSLDVTTSLRDVIETGNFDVITIEITEDLKSAFVKFAWSAPTLD